MLFAQAIALLSDELSKTSDGSALDSRMLPCGHGAMPTHLPLDVFLMHSRLQACIVRLSI